MMAMPTGPQPTTSAASPGSMRDAVDRVQSHGHRLGQGGVLGTQPLGTGSSSGADNNIFSA